MSEAFYHQMGSNVEAYIDDAIVKSMIFDDHLIDLEETFQALQRYKLKLNLGNAPSLW